MEPGKSNKFLKYTAWGIFSLACLLLFWGAFIEPNRLVVRRAVVTLPGLPSELEGCRVLLAGDTHFGNTFIDRLRCDRLIRCITAEKADISFLLGDYIAVGSVPGYGAMPDDKLLAFFKACKAPLGTYAVLGNHELWYGRKRMTALLEKAGVQMIENKAVKIRGGALLAGVPDSSTTGFDRKKFQTFVQKEKPLFLLSHKGNMLRYLKGPSRGIMFAADTHGGQIRIPGGSALHTYFSGKKELAPGLSTRWGRKLFITTGAGGHRLGFRLFCPPEIAVVTLTARKEV